MRRIAIVLIAALTFISTGCDDQEPAQPGSDTAPEDTTTAQEDGTTSTEDATTTSEDVTTSEDATPPEDATTDEDGVGEDTGGDVPPDTTTATDAEEDTADATLQGVSCSADLRDVLDFGGTVLGTCPTDQGCAEGMCVSPCEAARASSGSVGCDFRVAAPPAYPPARPPCHAVFVANTWPEPAAVTVRRGEQTFDVTAFGRIPENGVAEADWAAIPETGIPAGGVAVLFLSSDPAAVMPETGVPLSCPVTPAVNASTVISGSGTSEPFVIETDVPVSAYDILPYGGALSFFPSAQLLLPTHAWGTSYVVMGTPVGTAGSPGPMWLQVMGLDGESAIRARTSVPFPAAGPAPALTADTEGSFTLPADTVVQWELGTADASGSLVVSDTPIALMSGNRFFRLQKSPAPGGESTHQQLLPVSALAHRYVGAPYETRRNDLAAESVHYRLVGVIDGTQLTFDPPVSGAPTQLAQGQVVDFEATGSFVVESQDEDHPFAAAQIMATANLDVGSREGATTFHPSVCTSAPCRLGDEEFVILFPAAQYLRRYVFFTDPTYATTSLVLVRAKQDGAFHPVTVDCIGEVGGWQAVGTSGAYEMTTVDLVRANQPNGSCTNGRHLAESEAPFGLVVWGIDTYASYAYPAGGNAEVIVDITILN